MARPKSPQNHSSTTSSAPNAAPRTSPNPSPASRGRAAVESAQRFTSGRISADVDAFCQAGGRIEVIEITRPRDASDAAPLSHEPQPPPRQPMRRKPTT